MSNGNSDVGTKSATRTPREAMSQVMPQGLARPNVSAERRIDKQAPLKAKRPRISGAMSQQCADSGNHSALQKFVQLVGYRDPNARPESWVRPRPIPAKR